MAFNKGNQYRFLPKYTEEDLKVIRRLMKMETMVEDIFAIMMKRRPDVHPMSIYRWIEKVAKEK